MLLLVPVVNDGGEFTKTANIYCFGMLVTEVIEVIGSTPPFVVMRTFVFAIAKFSGDRKIEIKETFNRHV
ncbi:hypothetical protein C1646_758426 [Rhizophagus diaphanus]|nr:hypothetical protein C1646_758426 [Rhizophagus diaphanus] [Rhizophagus sp. MUCL 43196]